MAWVQKNSTAIDRLGRVVLLQEEAVGNVKTLDVTAVLGAARELHVDHIRIVLIADATVGTRMLRYRVLDGATILQEHELNPGTDTVASATTNVALLQDQRAYELNGAIEHRDFLLPIKLFGGLSLEVMDKANISAADLLKVYVNGTLQ